MRAGADRSVDSIDGLPRDSFDAAVDATGSVEVMSRAPDFVRPGGKVLLFGVPPAGQKISLEALPVFRKGLTILFSFTSLRNSYRALDLLASGRISVDALISHRLPLEDLQRGIEILEGGRENVRKVMILPNG